MYFVDGMQKKNTLRGVIKIGWVLDSIRRLCDKRVGEGEIFFHDMADSRNISIEDFAIILPKSNENIGKQR